MQNQEKMRRVIVKVGTSTLTAGAKQLNRPRMVELTRQIAALADAGCQVVLVTSGGIAAGREVMGYPDLPKFLPGKQMLAAVGQPHLMSIYTQLFGLFGKRIAQVLLIREDLSNRRRYLNARNTLEALLELNVIPIINENDTVATDEIRFGDNDNLSAMVVNVLEADLLILLTDQDGVYTADPRMDKNAQLVREITSETIPEELFLAAGGTSNGLGTGGMMTKLRAADLARRSGSRVVIANGSMDQVLTRIVIDQEPLGTNFVPLSTHLENRNRFLLSGMKDTAGTLRIDEGAAAALRAGGSLLPVGIRKVKGKFNRGESVTITDTTGKDVAVGLCNYSAEEVHTIAGFHSEKIEELLGYAYGGEVVHRNNLVLL